jgi:hypothetical protein
MPELNSEKFIWVDDLRLYRTGNSGLLLSHLKH